MKFITDNDEKLAFPADFSIEIKASNPFFSEEGTASIPFTLPSVPCNLSILDRPDFLARQEAYSYVGKGILYLSSCTFYGKLLIQSFSHSGGIAADFAFSESCLYTEDKKLLKDILKDKYFIEQQKDLASILNIWETMVFLNIEEQQKKLPGVVFPIKTSMDKDNNFFMLNEGIQDAWFDFASGGKRPSYSSDAFAKRTVVVKGNKFDVPEGYGATCFPYLSAFIEKVFTSLGYNVVENAFTEAPLSDIVILNNVADLICRYSVLWSDLAPSMSLGDFLRWLKNKFGAVVTIKNNEVKIRLIAKLLVEQVDIDLSPYAGDNETINIVPKSHVILTVKTGLPKAKPIDKPESKLGPQQEKNIINWEKKAETGSFYCRNFKEKGYSLTFWGTNAYKYDPSPEMEAETFEAEDEYVPLNIIEAKETIQVGEATPPNHIQGDNPADWEDWDRGGDHGIYEANTICFRLFPCTGDLVHLHTAVKDLDEKTNQPLMICYAIWDRFKDTFYAWNPTTQNITNTGHSNYPILTPCGLYSLYWKNYDELLRNAAPSITTKLYMPISLINSLDMATPKRYKGHKVMIKKLSYTLSDNAMTEVTAELQLLPEYLKKEKTPEYF